jgi:branched-chain amino acid aminotransferase
MGQFGEDYGMGQAHHPGFGLQFTAHMAITRFAAGCGWEQLQIVPHTDVALSPAAMVFHYGQALFEGLKAFRQPDGNVALFRPAENASRFDLSAPRLAMPTLPPGMFVEACGALVRADADEVPQAPGQSLYLRPLMIATEAALGVRAANEYLFAVIASPVDSYFTSAARPLALWVADDFVRAAPGGTGAAKCSSNYAASLLAQQVASGQGCDEVLWLDADERRWLGELSAMNMFAVSGSTLVTPPVDDTILDGITRRSLLQLAPTLGYETVERPVSIDELCDGRTFDEAFACGTAAVVAPIGSIHSTRGTSAIGRGTPGPVTAHLRDALVSIQEGRAPDLFGWLEMVNPPPAEVSGAA